MTDHDTDKKDKKSNSLSEKLAKFTPINPYKWRESVQKPAFETKPDAGDDAIDTETFAKLGYAKSVERPTDHKTTKKQVKKLEKKYDNFLHKEDHLKAFGCLEKILLLEPNSYFGFLREGDIFHHFERDDEALKSYEKCIDLNKKDGRAQNNMGNLFHNKNQLKKARKCYEESNKYDPTSPVGWANLGDTLDDLGQYKKAIKQFDEAIRLDKKWFNAWFGKAWA